MNYGFLANPATKEIREFYVYLQHKSIWGFFSGHQKNERQISNYYL